MEFKELEEIVNKEKNISERVYSLVEESQNKNSREVEANMLSLLQQLESLNKLIPGLVQSSLQVNKTLPDSSGKFALVKSASSVANEKYSTKDRKDVLQELDIDRELLRRLKKRALQPQRIVQREDAKPNKYVKISNRFFASTSEEMIKKGRFSGLANDIKQSKMVFLLKSYVSIILFTTLLVFFVSIGLFVFLLFFNITIFFPFITRYDGALLERILMVSWVMIILPLATYFSLLFYPSAERSHLGKSIDEEMPFLTIHMAAIAGSNVEPSKIFTILAASDEYPSAKKELVILMNRVNIYGYNLATALLDSARNCPSKKLKDLLNGISTTITSGGGLKEFLEQRAKTLLFEYKLDREKRNRSAETFIDIYISVVIAAPMIFMLLLVMISLSGIGPSGLGINALTLIMISAVAFINIIFLTVLHIKQPKE